MVTVISCCSLDGHCYFLVCPGCSLLFSDVLWMVTVISWCALDGHCYFLVCSGWSLLFTGVLWMVTVISWCALDVHCYFMVCSGWSLLFPSVPHAANSDAGVKNVNTPPWRCPEAGAMSSKVAGSVGTSASSEVERNSQPLRVLPLLVARETWVANNSIPCSFR